jgi:predicted transcriptional regulator of viral defense system
MTEPTTQKQRVLELAKERGVLSRADLREAELPEEYLSRLENEGELTALAPGIYMAPEHDASESLELAVVTKKVPHAVVFGISALQFHDLTTQIAHSVQIAIERGKWEPKLDWPPIEVFHISGDAFSAGVETHTIEKDVEIQIYSVAKTVADLYKFRNTFGLDVAVEALKVGWRYQGFTMDEVYEYAKICRVQRVMRPYLEMLQ